MGVHIVTGAFGYSGKYITALLLKQGQTVRTITDSPNRPNPFGPAVQAAPFHFDNPAMLVEALRGADVLYNTYWVRFDHRNFTFSQAVRNSRVLFASAREAGIRRIVHVSITNPSADSRLGYFRGKALVEQALTGSGVSHAILRPAVLFGKEDILVNNIAWTLRRIPVFGVFGDGNYCLQPIHVEDFAEIAVHAGRGSQNIILDAIGPETFTFRSLVETIGSCIGKRRPVISVPPWLAYWAAWIIGKFVGDVFLTRDEIQGLMSGLFLFLLSM
jgi:NADH dehydrogenase